MSAESAQRSSPAAERNAAPILAVLRRVLPPAGHMLEVASGLGQHAAHFAAALPDWSWQPTDQRGDAFGSIAAWTEGLANVRAPLLLDVLTTDWPAGPFDAVYCANMFHVAPWAACAALMRGAARCLRPSGLLVTYGPYRIDGVPLEPSNAAFDADLRARDPAWGLRLLSEVVAAAAESGLVLRERVAMPANNQMLVFERIGQ